MGSKPRHHQPPQPPPAPHFKLIQKSIDSSVLQDRVSIAELLSDGVSLAQIIENQKK